MEGTSDKTLLLFDFDGTIVDGDIAHTLLGTTLTKEELKLVMNTGEMNYAQSMDRYYKLMKSKGKTKNDLPLFLNIIAYIKKN